MKAEPAMPLDKKSLHLPSALEMWKTSGKTIRITIQGNSMAPFIAAGESVSVRLSESPDLKKGDLLAFREGESIVVHRYVSRKREQGRVWVCQKGDSLSGYRWIPEDRVLGRVESVQGNTGTRDMNRWPWVLINRASGYAWSLRVTLYEKFRAGKAIC